MARDYYSILQVSPTASPDEVKKSYRRLVRQYHPDTSDSEEKKQLFLEIQEAYDILSNPNERTEYDRKKRNEQLQAYQKTQSKAERGFTRTTTTVKRDELDPQSEKLDQILRSYKEKRAEAASASSRNKDSFSGRRPEPTSAKEDDSTVLKRFKNTVVNSIHKTSSMLRPDLKQTPPPIGTRPVGQENTFHFTIDALESLSETSREISLPSGDAGRIIRVKIPAGIRDGAQLKVNCPATDKHQARELDVRIHLTPHPYVERDRDDIILSFPISVAEAMNGATIDCPTPEGVRRVSSPLPWTPEAKVKLEGVGLPTGDGKKRGDIYLRTYIVLPDIINDACKSAAKVLEEFQAGPVRRNLPPIFRKPN